MVKSIHDTIELSDGNKIPQLGLGVWQAKDGEEVETAIRAAAQLGYRSFDTAMGYGNEKGVGYAIRTCGVARDKLFVTTKLWNADQGYESTLDAFNKSLKRLGLKQTMFYPFKLASMYGRGYAVKGVVKSDKHRAKLVSYAKNNVIDIPLVQSAAYDPEGKALNLFVLNADAEAVELNIDLRSFGKASLREHIVLDGKDVYACNDLSHPNTVTPHTVVGSACEETGSVCLTPYSWNVLRFACD